MIVIGSLQYLVNAGLVNIFGYVIMPNHIHLIWRVNHLNGKENPTASFAKFTAHQFNQKLKLENPQALCRYAVQKLGRHYQFWKRDPCAIPLLNEKILVQRLSYIHNNTVREKWKLCSYPEGYRWSSARFYHDGYDEFSILTHFKD